MKRSKEISINGIIMLLLILVNIIILKKGLTTGNQWYWVLVFTVPIIAIALIHGWWKRSKK
jgi:cytochrome bd-type quinol oxidase subunit 1